MEAARLRISFVIKEYTLTTQHMKLLTEYPVQERSYDGIRGNITLRNAYLTFLLLRLVLCGRRAVVSQDGRDVH